MLNSGWNRWRKSCVAVTAAMVFSAAVVVAPVASALGLGEIETRSALNERFAAEIELLDTRSLDSAEVLASLASSDDFRRVGVERFFFLTSLKFAVERNPRGNLVIKATSQQPITEPYLNFLVEVLWPSGRLLKEYTVLLDPPTFTHSAAAPVAAPSRESSDIASAGRVQRELPIAPTTPIRTTQPNTSPSASNASSNNNDGTYGRTTRNDTMWAIANETLPSNNVTPQQNMLAIQRLNPTAFIDGNVNLLKKGVVLRLPAEGEIDAIDNAEAVVEIDQQKAAWQSGSPARTASRAAASEAGTNQASAAPVDATSRGPGAADTKSNTAAGRLSIVATDASGVIDGIDSSGSSDVQTVVSGDPAAQERIETLARQVDELTYQLDLQKRGVEEQISTREQTINLKDQQIAQLQEQLKTIRETGQDTDTAAQSQDQSTPTSQVDEKPLWQQPWLLGSVLGGLALLLAFTLFKKRGQAASSDLALDDLESSEPSFELADSENSQLATPMVDVDLADDLDDADDALDRADDVQAHADIEDELSNSLDSNELSDDDLFGAADDVPVAAKTGDAPQTSDVIGEADIYIAYGRYPQAIALLQGAVDANPDDHAVRIRLLEVSAETKDAQGYAEQASLLRSHCDDADTLAAADSLHSSLDDDLRAQIDGLMPDSGGDSSADSSGRGMLGGLAAAGGAALAAGAARVMGSDDAADSADEFTEEPEPFAFDTTVTDDADALGALDELSTVADSEFELDLESVDADLDGGLEFDAPAVNTDQFATNVDMASANTGLAADLGIDSATEVEDFELDLDLEVDASDAFVAEAGDADLGGDLGLNFPAETDDDQMLDEIERSLDELEADGLLTPELDEEGEFSFDDDADTSATKLDLARAYIDMGDDDGAREILDEVITEGDSGQKGEASELLNKL